MAMGQVLLAAVLVAKATRCLLEGLVGSVGVRGFRNDLVAFATSPRSDGDFVR